MRLLALLLLAPWLAFADQPVDAGPYVPSPQSMVSVMLKLADVGPNDFVVDLGSGDGRIVRTAALVFGARGFGVEIKDELVRQANADAAREGIAGRVKFVNADLFKTDISQATVVTMYLLPDTVNLLRKKLLTELRPGTRVLSHDYPLDGWEASKHIHMDLEDKVKISGVTTTLIWMYIVPANVDGRWTAQLQDGQIALSLKQDVTKVSGAARFKNGKQISLVSGKLRGERISFSIAGKEYVGRVEGAEIQGQGGAWSARRVR